MAARYLIVPIFLYKGYKMDYLFSLVLPTLGRSKELDIFCQSLVNQTYRKFELIVIDQNSDDRVERIVEAYKDKICIVYIRSGKMGLSFNRNIGLEKTNGDIIAFPDDDCEYKPDTLRFVNDFFNTHDYDFFTFNYGDKASGQKAFNIEKRKITFRNLLRTAISFTIFVKEIVMKTPGCHFLYDEKLGVGAEFGSGEESDMVAWFLFNKYRGFYDGMYSIYHDIGRKPNDDFERAYNYALGFGALHKKLILKYKRHGFLLHYLYRIARNIAAIVVSPYKKRYACALKGKILGFLRYRIKNDT
jgi:glycosyltransferase involved in cell wall biosynthesis